MKPGLNHDQFEVINGPEDGSIFHLIRSPVDIGRDGQYCGITLQMDQRVSALHARVTVVSNGYRIRSFGGNSVMVNGKRAGTIRSCFVRSGDIVRIGQTELALYCAEEGLARRSQGIASESDFAWALHLFRRRVVRLLTGREKY